MPEQWSSTDRSLRLYIYFFEPAIWWVYFLYPFFDRVSAKIGLTNISWICRVVRAHFYTGVPCMCALRGFHTLGIDVPRAFCVAVLRTRYCIPCACGYPCAYDEQQALPTIRSSCHCWDHRKSLPLTREVDFAQQKTEGETEKQELPVYLSLSQLR